MATMTVGSIIEIMRTDNVTSRFPQLIGSVGRILSVPTHPSTWFTVKLFEDDRVVKLQATAMKHLAKGDPRRQQPQQGGSTKSTTATASSNKAKVLHQPNNSPPRPRPSEGGGGGGHGGIGQYRKGVAVKIRATESVIQRCPHLVGTIGTVKEVPVHPTTWFKIAFPDGSVATFRPTAFKLADGSEDDEHDVYENPPAKAPAVARKPVTRAPKQSSAAAQKTSAGSSSNSASSSCASSSSASSSTTASDSEADSSSSDNGHGNDEIASGMTVLIREGKLRGATGEVLKLANGWVSVMTSEGEVAKRVHELVPTGRRKNSPPRSHTAPSSSSSSAMPTVSRHALEKEHRSKSGRVIRAVQNPPSASASSLHPSSSSSSLSSISVHIKGPGSLHHSRCHPSDARRPPAQQKSHHHHSHNKPNRFSLFSSKGPSSSSAPTAMPDMPFVFPLERQFLDCPFPVVSLAERKAKRSFLEDMVEREASMIDGRPNLSQWLNKIHVAFGAVDAEEENCSYASYGNNNNELPADKATAAGALLTLEERKELIKRVCVEEGLAVEEAYEDATAKDELTIRLRPIAEAPDASVAQAAAVLASASIFDVPYDDPEGEAMVAGEGDQGDGAMDVVEANDEDEDQEDVEEEEDEEEVAAATAAPTSSMEANVQPKTSLDRRLVPAKRPLPALTHGQPPAPLSTALSLSKNSSSRQQPTRSRSDSLADTDSEDALSPELVGYSDARPFEYISASGQLVFPARSAGQSRGKDDEEAIREAVRRSAPSPLALPPAEALCGEDSSASPLYSPREGTEHPLLSVSISGLPVRAAAFLSSSRPAPAYPSAPTTDACPSAPKDFGQWGKIINPSAKVDPLAPVPIPAAALTSTDPLTQLSQMTQSPSKKRPFAAVSLPTDDRAL